MAGFFGFGNYMKEGKGVDKDAPKKRGLFAFIELFFRKFWKLIRLNMLYLISNIPTLVILFLASGVVSSIFLNEFKPIVEKFSVLVPLVDLGVRLYVSLLFIVFWGGGPVTCGYTYILRNYSREEHAWLFSDFWQHTKENFKQSFVVLLVDVFVFVALVIAYYFYSKQAGVMQVFKYVILLVSFIYTMAHFYLYPLMVTFKLSLKDIYRNSFIFAFAYLPKNILITILVSLVHIFLPMLSIYTGSWFMLYLFVFLVLEVCILVSLGGFIVNFSVYPSIKKDMLEIADPDKYGEKIKNSDESVFSDENLL